MCNARLTNVQCLTVQFMPVKWYICNVHTHPLTDIYSTLGRRRVVGARVGTRPHLENQEICFRYIGGFLVLFLHLGVFLQRFSSYVFLPMWRPFWLVFCSPCGRHFLSLSVFYGLPLSEPYPMHLYTLYHAGIHVHGSYL